MMTPDRLATELTRRLDGPHSDEHTAGAARLTAEAIRFLNYATGHHADSGLTYPATAYDILGSLSATAHRLPQALQQLAAWLDAEHAAGRLADDHHRPVADLVLRAHRCLRQAGSTAASLGDALADAQNAISTLHQSGDGR
jgi:hypothetical protein